MCLIMGHAVTFEMIIKYLEIGVNHDQLSPNQRLLNKQGKDCIAARALCYGNKCLREPAINSLITNNDFIAY